MLSDLRYRFRALFRRKKMERDLDDELRFHIDNEIEKHMRSGLSYQAAQSRALREFGGLDGVKEAARDARGIAWIDALLQDVRYAWRGLKARPAFALGVVLTLGLGVGANTAMFGIVDRLLFRPPAFLRDAERVHRVYLSSTEDGTEQTESALAYRRYLDLRAFSQSFEASAAFATGTLPVGSGTDTREMPIMPSSASLFGFFDAEPVIGRFFTEAEDRAPQGENVVVLSYAYWQTAFGGSNDALGKDLHVGEALYTIIGVAPPEFTGVSETTSPGLFIPITAFAYSNAKDYADHYGWTWLRMVVRRKPGVSTDVAHADLTAAYERSWIDERGGPAASVARLRAEVASVLLGRGPQAGTEAKVVAWVMGVALIVLLVACANVVNLLLARSVQRRREIALRLALGVSRLRLVQQLMTETLLLAALGGLVGLAAAQWGGRTLRAMFLPDEGMSAVAGDARTLLFTAVATLSLALLTGLVPGLQAFRSDVAGTLKAGSRDSGYQRSGAQPALLVFQGALSVVLLVGAGLFIRSVVNVRSLRLGYDVEPVVLIQRDLRGVGLEPVENDALTERLLAAARRVPGVQGATPAVSVPFANRQGRTPHVPGRDSIQRLGSFTLQAGSPDYFRTTGTRIVQGRGFTVEDRAGTPPVVIVSEQMASALWPEEGAVGQRMRIGSDTMPFLTVVGVAENVRGARLDGDPELWYFLPVDQYRALVPFGPSFLFVRVDGRAEDYVTTLRSALQREMPGDSFVSVMPLGDVIATQQRAWQFGATMFVAFAALALALAAVGLYSVMAYAVASRTRELGVRIALGATLGDVARQVMAKGVAFAAAGVALGSAIAMIAGRWIEPLLFDTAGRDPLVFAAVGGILLTVAALATLRPAWRATHVDPTITLRTE